MSKKPSMSKKILEKKQNQNEKSDILDKEKINGYLDYKDILSGLPNHVFRFKKDKQGRITLSLSEGKIAEKFEISTNSIKDRNLKDIFSNKKEYGFIKHYYDRAFSGEKVEYEVEINNTWFKTIVQPFKKDSEDNVTEIIGYSEEISERKKAENKIRATREDWCNSFNSLDDVMLVIDKDYNIEEINNKGLKLFGMSREDTIGKKCYQVVHNAEKPCNFCPFERSLITKEAESIEKYEEKFGIYFSIKSSPVFDENEELVKFVGLMRDITKRKKAEEKVIKYQKNLEKMVEKRTEELKKAHLDSERTKNNLQNIIDSSSEIIISFDKTNRVLTWGKRIEQLTGFTRKKIVGKNIQKTKVFGDTKELLENIEKISQGKPPQSNIIALNTKNGSKRIIKTSFSPIKKDDIYDGVVLIGEDITLQIESHGRFINGYSYYSLDRKNESIFHLFKNLVELYSDTGLYITRSNSEYIKNNIKSKKIQTMILKQKDLDEIVKRIKNFVEQNKKPIIFLDRVDYLISNFSFNQFIKYLYMITDIISENNAIFILCVKPSFFDEKQLSLIKSELLSIPSQQLEEIQIKDDSYEILKLVNRYTQNNILVEFKKISAELSINRKTLSKKINKLEKQGLILIRRYGRSKTPYLTDKAKAILNKKVMK